MRKESHDFDSYLGSLDRLVAFEIVLVDRRNEIMCFGCVFFNTIVKKIDDFSRFPLIAILFPLFWVPIQFIAVIKLRVLVVFSGEL